MAKTVDEVFQNISDSNYISNTKGFYSIEQAKRDLLEILEAKMNAISGERFSKFAVLDALRDALGGADT